MVYNKGHEMKMVSLFAVTLLLIVSFPVQAAMTGNAQEARPRVKDRGAMTAEGLENIKAVFLLNRKHGLCLCEQTRVMCRT